MGDRASYAIRRDGKIELFFSDWGAATLLADIFWGPEICEAQIRKQESAEHWLDDVYGEAAVALCRDTRTVAFYDCRFSEEVRETAARMMAAIWGWTVKPVAYVSGVAAALGVDLIGGAQPSSTGASLLALDGMCDEEEPPRRCLFDWHHGGARELRMASADPCAMVLCGPALLTALPRASSIEEVRAAIAGEPLLVSHSGSTAVIIIDEDARRLRVTLLPSPSATGDLAALRGLAGAWPGWDVAVAIDAVTLAAAPDLLPVVQPTPVAEHVRELAGLLGDDAFKAWARTWLGKVYEPFAEHAPADVDLDLDERLRRFALGLAALSLSAEEVRSAMEEATRATNGGEVERRTLPGQPERGLIGETIVEVGGATYAVHQPMEGYTPTGGATLLAWTGGSPRALCKLTNTPVRTPRVSGVPGYARLHVSPSGRALLAILQTDPYSLVWIELEPLRSTRIAIAARAADFDVGTKITWRGDGRFALQIVDRTATRFGSPCVVVFDGSRGWGGEVPGLALAGWDPSSEPGRRAEAIARMTGLAPREATGEVARLAAIARSDRELAKGSAEAAFELDPSSRPAFTAWARALKETGDHVRRREACERHLAHVADNRDAWFQLCRAHQLAGAGSEAVAAGSRCVELAPFWHVAHWQLACALVLTGELAAAARAATRAVECLPRCVDEIAVDDDLRPLWGHPEFRAIDYARCLIEARKTADTAALERAIAIDPARMEAHRELLVRLVDLGRDDDAVREARVMLERDPDAYGARIQLARVAMHREDAPGAIDQLTQGQAAFDRSAHHPWTTFGEEVARYAELAPLLGDEPERGERDE